MWNTALLEWNAQLNRARSALLEQENLLAILEHAERPGVVGHLPDRRKALADWGATRRRFLHAYYRLVELVNAPDNHQPAERVRVVERLEKTARHLQDRFRDMMGDGAGRSTRTA